MRRSSIETIERLVKDVHQSPAEHARERRLSLTMMNCIWARNTDVETSDPVAGDITGKKVYLFQLQSLNNVYDIMTIY